MFYKAHNENPYQGDIMTKTGKLAYALFLVLDSLAAFFTTKHFLKKYLAKKKVERFLADCRSGKNTIHVIHTS